MKTSLRDRTLELLINRSIILTFKKISEDTQISEEWLSSFARNKISNPGVNTIQTLYEYLNKQEIQV